MTNMAIFEDKKSSNVIIINDAMSDDEVVASDVPRGTCYPQKQPYSSFKSNTGYMDGKMDGWTDGRILI